VDKRFAVAVGSGLNDDGTILPARYIYAGAQLGGNHVIQARTIESETKCVVFLADLSDGLGCWHFDVILRGYFRNPGPSR
jgi:hypothetical protein